MYGNFPKIMNEIDSLIWRVKEYKHAEKAVNAKYIQKL